MSVGSNMTHVKEIGEDGIFVGTDATDREDSKFRQDHITTAVSYH